ncbi:hypothetical protein FB446DRAFT_299719 [Lentinula raphanica]|nr:hypothetical protein FB446DRAFT_299719 [Lentinula raphanica]
MRPTATHFLFTITTLQFVASMESNLGGCASSQEVSSSGGESRPLSNDEKLTLQEFPLSKYCKPSENWPGKTPENPLTYKHLGSSHGNPQSTDLTEEGSEKSKTTERFQSPTGQTSPFGESRPIRPPFADPSKPPSVPLPPDPPSGKSIPPPPGSPPTGPLPHPPQSGPPPTGPLPPLPGSKNPVLLDNTAPPPIPRRSSRRLPKDLRVPALQVSAPQIQEKRGYYEPVGTDYASNTAPDAAAIDEDPSDTDSAIVQSTEGRSPTGKEIRLTRAFNRRRILDWDLD